MATLDSTDYRTFPWPQKVLLGSPALGSQYKEAGIDAASLSGGLLGNVAAAASVSVEQAGEGKQSTVARRRPEGPEQGLSCHGCCEVGREEEGLIEGGGRCGEEGSGGREAGVAGPWRGCWRPSLSDSWRVLGPPTAAQRGLLGPPLASLP